jgi:uncharacterized protein (DUF885 family)
MKWPYRLITVSVLLALGCARPPAGSEPQRFRDLVQKSFTAEFEFGPSSATYEGDHRFDDRLEDWNRAAIDKEAARLQRTLTDLAAIDRAALDAGDQVDYDLFQSHLKARLFDLTEIRPWETNPGSYNFGYGIEALAARDFAPQDVRLRSVVARLSQVGRQLANARRNLKNPPRLFTESAGEDFQGTIAYLRTDVPKAFAEVKDPKLLAEYDEAVRKAASETESFVKWLHDTLLPQSNGSYVLGEERYRKKLLYDDMIDLPVDTMLAMGDRELSRLKTRYRLAARHIDRSWTLDQVLALMRRDHPPAESLLSYARMLTDEDRAFCDTSGFLAIPKDAHIEVRPTPQFAAAHSFASFDGPGPLETKATSAYYNITLPGADWDSARVAQYLQGFGRWPLASVSLHEVYPGHYAHFLYAKNAPSYVRKTCGSGCFAEGWGLYVEEGAIDAGYRKGDARTEFGVMRWALVRACRLEVGLRVHTRGMSLEDATRYFMDNAGLERVNAEREAYRAAFDPTYIIYTLGALQIRQLRQEVKAAQGDAFDLGRFHASMLSQGSLPVVLLRRILLPTGGPSS